LADNGGEVIPVLNNNGLPNKEKPSFQSIPGFPSKKFFVPIKKCEEKHVLFEVRVREDANLHEPTLEDMEFFKDVEVAFLDGKYNSESEGIGDEGKKDRSFEENLPRRYRRKAASVTSPSLTRKHYYMKIHIKQNFIFLFKSCSLPAMI
jgi:hypothetical protein